MRLTAHFFRMIMVDDDDAIPAGTPIIPPRDDIRYIGNKRKFTSQRGYTCCLGDEGKLGSIGIYTGKIAHACLPV